MTTTTTTTHTNAASSPGALSVNHNALEEGLRRARVLATIDDAIVDAIREAIVTQPDEELYRINPVTFAHARGLSVQRTTDAMVAAAKAGVFELAWGLTCPWCGLYVSQLPRLADVTAEFYCSVCDRASASVLDSFVEVAFRPRAEIRKLQVLEHAAKDPQRMFGLYQNRSVTRSRGIGQIMNEYGHFQIAPGNGTAHLEDPLPPGDKCRIVSVTHDRNASFDAEGKGVVATIEESGITLSPSTRSGVTFINKTPVSSLVALMRIPKDMLGRIEHMGPATFGEHLSGKDLLCNQVFRDLFGSETLSAGIALTVESLTMLFTDLKGSTALYDQIGDVRAFALVSEHFKILLAAVQEHGGAVVKTIGDAVMGAFPSSSDALKAALVMAERLNRFNTTSGLPPLSLKIGLHSGPCIVVNSNERLDYFGQTVNVAARVQGLAEGDELVLSDVVRNMSGVNDLIKSLPVQTSMAQLKGVGEQLKVHTVQLAASA